MASTDHRGWIWRTGLALVLLLVSAVVPAQAQKFKVLHTFHSGKGPQSPLGALTLDREGNLYGVAQGGTGICFSGTYLHLGGKLHFPRLSHSSVMRFLARLYRGRLP
jgi:hypothetical protein